jgi:DNA-directed RNA polymerase subunit L
MSHSLWTLLRRCLAFQIADCQNVNYQIADPQNVNFQITYRHQNVDITN